MIKKATNSTRYRKRNPGIVPLDNLARVECADDKDPSNRDKNSRLAVECIFVITYSEKLDFMKSVEKLGPLRATQVMCAAVIEDARRNR